ncbi:MAG: hypothetical protein GXP35_05020 [Actinobacteria bacterium]|nr:hypothetical protein [Actinomycetota bacterium]
MDERAPVDVVGADQQLGDASDGEVERRPPWLLGALVLAALTAILIVSLATRDAATVADEDTTPETTFAPATTTTSPGMRAETSNPRPTIENITPDPTVTNVGGTEVEFLPLSQDLVDVLPPGGIDGWLFSVKERGQLTRTDLTTGEEARISFDGDQTDNFFPGRPTIVLLEDKVALTGDDHLLVVDIDTLSTTRIDHERGVASILANDNGTVWLQTTSTAPRGGSSIFSINVDTLEVTEPLLVDPLGIAFVVAGASDAILRFHVPFLGSWEIAGGVSQQIDNSILAGTNGGTLEVSCGDSPDECTVLIREFAGGAETPIQVAPEILSFSISPNLDAVAQSTQVVYTDGSVVDLDDDAVFNSIPWVWSSDGRFLVSSDQTIVDLTGEFETFKIPGGPAFSDGPIATLLVMRG